MLDRPASGGFDVFYQELINLAAVHNPETCKTPGHVIVQADDGNLYCGSGGYWPVEDGWMGRVIVRGGLAVEGKFIRENPPDTRIKDVWR